MISKENIESLLKELVLGKELKSILSKRKKDHVTKGISYEMREKYESDGWMVDREFKTKVRMKKTKSHDIAFEDKVWVTLANLGFNQLNRDRYFIPYSDDESLTQQIDVIAIDNQTILLVECKSATKNSKGNFKKEIEAVGDRK